MSVKPQSEYVHMRQDVRGGLAVRKLGGCDKTTDGWSALPSDADSPMEAIRTRYIHVISAFILFSVRGQESLSVDGEGREAVGRGRQPVGHQGPVAGLRLVLVDGVDVLTAADMSAHEEEGVAEGNSGVVVHTLGKVCAY